MYLPFEVQAHIHSKKDTDQPIGKVTILEKLDNNNIIAEVDGQKCTAIFNVFNCRYYVDDVYGKLPPDATLNRYQLPKGHER